MATLVFNHEEIAARELKPELLEMDGISRASVEAHYKLYEGYVNKRNEILKKLADVDLSTANQVYSDVRALKIDLTFAIGGVKNHEIYFEHLGGGGGDPDGAVGSLIERDFGSVDAWRADLKATGMGGRGWAWTAYDWDEGRLFNYLGDTQNTYPIWNASPLGSRNSHLRVPSLETCSATTSGRSTVKCCSSCARNSTGPSCSTATAWPVES